MSSVELKRPRIPLLIIILCLMPTLAHANLSGWVFMPVVPGDGFAIGYSLVENDWVYLYSSQPTYSLHIFTGQWTIERPVGWTFVDWPFYYELDTDTWWFVLPPEDGLWVYHFSTDEWTVSPRIIP